MSQCIKDAHADLQSFDAYFPMAMERQQRLNAGNPCVEVSFPSKLSLELDKTSREKLASLYKCRFDTSIRNAYEAREGKFVRSDMLTFLNVGVALKRLVEDLRNAAELGKSLQTNGASISIGKLLSSDDGTTPSSGQVASIDDSRVPSASSSKTVSGHNQGILMVKSKANSERQKMLSTYVCEFSNISGDVVRCAKPILDKFACSFPSNVLAFCLDLGDITEAESCPWWNPNTGGIGNVESRVKALGQLIRLGMIDIVLVGCDSKTREDTTACLKIIMCPEQPSTRKLEIKDVFCVRVESNQVVLTKTRSTFGGALLTALVCAHYTDDLYKMQ